MANVQDSQDSGVSSYGQPDEAALAKLSGTSAPPVENTATANPAQYNSVDELLTGQPASVAASATPAPKQYDTVDDLLNEGKLAQPVSRFTGAPIPGWARSLQDYAASATKTLDAFTGGTVQAETQDLGFSHETQDWMRKIGIYNDYSKGENDFGKSLNEALLNRLATTTDALMRLPAAPFEGIAQGAESQGADQLAMTARIAPNLFMEHFSVGLPEPVAAARSEGVIGEGEPGFMGTQELTPQDGQARVVAGVQVPPPQDIHALARTLAPETFNEYDALDEQRTILGNQMRELSAGRPADIEASAPHTEEIADLQDRLENEDLTERKAQRLQERLDDLTEKNKAFIEEARAQPSEDMETVRQAYNAVDYRMRDMAPDVTAAYREAQERLPAMPEPEIAIAAAERAPVSSAANAAQAQPNEAPVDVTRDEDMLRAIAQDASKKMQATGTNAEVADHAGLLIAENYQSVAEQFGGEKGTARDLYDKGLKIVPARGAVRERAPELAQEVDDTPAGKQSVIPGAEKISDRVLAERKMAQPMKARVVQQPADEGLFGDAHKQGELFSGNRGSTSFSADGAQAVMKLFKAQNASTPIHELGHIWLNNLLRFASDERAPAQMVGDASTVRKWLGVPGDASMRERNENGDFSYRKQHERFATGIERYLMEGHAPSRALDGVFARFKGWMLNIYNTLRRQNKLSDITPEIRQVFDRLLAAKPERAVIAPERAETGIFGRVPETEVEAATPEEAPAVAEGIKTGRQTITTTHMEDENADINRGTAPETEGRSAGGAEPDGAGNAPGAAQAQAGNSQVPASSGDTGGQAAPKGNQASGGAKAGAKYPIIRLLRENGGVRIGSKLDQELRSMGVTPQKFPGLFRKAKGLGDVDNFPANKWKLSGGPPEDGNGYVDRNFILESIGRELAGKPITKDALKAEKAYSSEMDEMASRLGIDSTGMTHEQFWNEARDRLSTEEQARIAAEQETATAKLFEEAQKAQQEFLTSRGESWEPEDVKSRTLEDLENERQQEITAGKTYPRNASAGEPGSTGADQGGLSEDDQRGGRGAGTGPEPAQGGREPGGTPAGDVTGSVLDVAGNPKYDLIEKRIEKINTPDDVDNFIRNAAVENDAFSEARRSTVSHAQTFALAEAMGVDGNFYDVMQTRKSGEAYNAHQLKAAEALFKTLATDAFEKSQLPKTPENMAAFAAANQKFLMATNHFMGAASEAGRALNILRTMSQGVKQAKDIQEFFQKNAGMTANDVAKQMDFMSKLDKGANQAAFIHASQKATFRDMMLEYYVNSLLSGPLTHARYMVGNAIKAIETPLVEIPLAAAHGAIRQALGKEELPDRVYFREALAQLTALGKGSVDGLRAAATAWKTGQSPFLPGEMVREYRPNAIPGKIGEAINIPSSAIEAIHGFSKTVRYTQNIAGLSTRAAIREGLSGDALDRRVAELTKTPTEAMMNTATKDALKELYMAPADYNSLSGTLVRVTNSNMLAKIIVPFMKIGTQITREAFVERTPLGALLSQDVRDNLMGRNGGAARDMQTGKIVTGTALLAATSAMVMAGNATGDGPNDPRQRAEWLLTHRPNTMTIGDISIPYVGLGSLGMLMRFAANMTETSQHWNEEDGGKLGISFLEGISKSVLDDNWMRGVKDMLDAVYHPEEYGARYVQNMATNWLPFSVGMGQVARAVDPYQREVKTHGMENGFGLLDAIRDRIPGISESLLPRYDAFGKPVPNGANLNYQNDAVVQRMDALRIFPSQLQRKIRGVQLTDQQFADYSNIAGTTVKMRLDQIVAQPGFTKMPAASQIEVMNNTIKMYREQARNAVLMKYPQITRDATAAKRKDQTLGQ